ncbi:unnamed protein product [Closterium sp. NIES-64]|nr:unnamed protein product [Closterium sp. NIES-64]
MPDVATNGQATRRRGSLKALFNKYAVDWGVLLLIVAGAIAVNFIEPFPRFVDSEDMEGLMYPLLDNTVPSWAVPLIALAPAAIAFLVSLRHPQGHLWTSHHSVLDLSFLELTCKPIRKDIVEDIHHSVLGLLFAFFSAILVAESLKVAVRGILTSLLFAFFSTILIHDALKVSVGAPPAPTSSSDASPQESLRPRPDFSSDASLRGPCESDDPPIPYPSPPTKAAPDRTCSSDSLRGPCESHDPLPPSCSSFASPLPPQTPGSFRPDFSQSDSPQGVPLPTRLSSSDAIPSGVPFKRDLSQYSSPPCAPYPAPSLESRGVSLQYSSSPCASPFPPLCRFLPESQEVYSSSGNALCLAYLSFFLAAKLHSLSSSATHLWRLLPPALPLVGGVAVGITRIDDYWHFPFDVFVGSLIGISFAAICYFMHYPSLRHDYCHLPRDVSALQTPSPDCPSWDLAASTFPVTTSVPSDAAGTTLVPFLARDPPLTYGLLRPTAGRFSPWQRLYDTTSKSSLSVAPHRTGAAFLGPPLAGRGPARPPRSPPITAGEFRLQLGRPGGPPPRHPTRAALGPSMTAGESACSWAATSTTSLRVLTCLPGLALFLPRPLLLHSLPHFTPLPLHFLLSPPPPPPHRSSSSSFAPRPPRLCGTRQPFDHSHATSFSPSSSPPSALPSPPPPSIGCATPPPPRLAFTRGLSRASAFSVYCGASPPVGLFVGSSTGSLSRSMLLPFCGGTGRDARRLSPSHSLSFKRRIAASPCRSVGAEFLIKE